MSLVFNNNYPLTGSNTGSSGTTLIFYNQMKRIGTDYSTSGSALRELTYLSNEDDTQCLDLKDASGYMQLKLNLTDSTALWDYKSHTLSGFVSTSSTSITTNTITEELKDNGIDIESLHIEDAAITNLLSATDGTATWTTDHKLSGFASISSTSITDTVATLTSGNLSGIGTLSVGTIDEAKAGAGVLCNIGDSAGNYYIKTAKNATIGTDNIMIGDGAGNGLNATCNSNILIGKNAGYTMATDPDGAVAIGYEALYSNTNGNNHVAIGYQAGYYQNLTSVGSYSTFCGYQAGKGTTLFTSGPNTAFGARALEVLNGGSNNCAVGYRSLGTLTSGIRNTAISSASGANILTGQYNICVGYTSDVKDTDDTYNILIGAGETPNNCVGDGTTGYIGIGNSVNYTKFQVGTTALTSAKLGYLTFDLSAPLTGEKKLTFSDTTMQLYNSLTFKETGGGSDLITISPPATSSTYTLTLPAAQGSANSILSNDGSGNLSFTLTPSGLTSLSSTTLYCSTLTEEVKDAGTVLNIEDSLFNYFINTGKPVGLTTGTRNVAIGTSTIAATTTASDNIAIGYQALTATILHGENVAIGSEAMKNTTSSEKNTCIGYHAAATLTTGDSNIIIGYGANTIATDTKVSIAIGDQQVGYSNEIAIGTNIDYTSSRIGYAGTTFTKARFGNLSLTTSALSAERTITWPNTDIDFSKIPSTAVPRYDDVFISGLAVATGGANPALTQYGATGQYGYAFQVNDVCYVSIDVPHSYKEGTDVVLHVHWLLPANAGAGAEYLKSQVLATWTNNDGTVASTTTITGYTTIAAGTGAGKVIKTDLSTPANLSGATRTIGSVIWLTLSRVDASGIGTEYNTNPLLLSVSAHYQMDTVGSTSAGSK